MERWQLRQMQNLPLEIKILKTQQRIKEWYDYWNGDVYISYSGGKDSTVLLDLVRSMYPDVPAVFLDTGLEYPELREHALKTKNLEVIKPKKNFRQVIKEYGYPAISKEQSQYIYEYLTAKSEKTKNTRWNGNKWGRGKISEKWKYLIDAPFNVSDKCCDVMKKNPVKRYEKQTGRKPFLGTMAEESQLRVSHYLKTGCNGFEMKRPVSNPIGFWTEQDVLAYLYKYNLDFPSVYGEIIYENNEYRTTGESRTGCMFCMFGVHKEPEPNKFQRMAHTHPKLYNYCINKLGIGEVLDYIGVNYEPSEDNKTA